MVLDEVNNLMQTGRAKINGMEWTARSKEDDVIIPAGEQAEKVEIQGVKLILTRTSVTPTETQSENAQSSDTVSEPDDIQIV
jgi:uncharacterized protein (UPF0210 family)